MCRYIFSITHFLSFNVYHEQIISFLNISSYLKISHFVKGKLQTAQAALKFSL